MPDCLIKFKCMLNMKYGLFILPVFHTMNYRNIIMVDYASMFNRGPRTLISLSGRDKRKALIMSESLEAYLRELHLKFTNGYFYTRNNIITSFPSDVRLE